MSSTGDVSSTIHDTSGTELDCDEEPLWGLKTTSPGVIYQVKLLMLFMIRGLKKYDFKLWTEKKFAGKFDDLVFWYREKSEEKNETNAGTEGNAESKGGEKNKENEKSEKKGAVKGQYRFLQAKHSQVEGKTITAADLTRNSGDFSLQKYFISWRDIRNHPKLKGYELGDYTICANYPFNEKTPPKRGGFYLTKVEKTDSILDFEDYPLDGKKPMRYWFKDTDGLMARELIDVFLGKKSPKTLNKSNPVFMRYRTELIKQQVIKSTESFSFTKNFENYLKDLKKNKKITHAIFCVNLLKKMSGSANDTGKKINESTVKMAAPFSQPTSTEAVLDEEVAEKVSDRVPDKEIEENEIEAYFAQLVFAVDQPNEVQLEKIIESELQTMGPEVFARNAELAYCYLQKKMLDWFKEKGGRSLTHKDAKRFIEEFDELLKKPFTETLPNKRKRIDYQKSESRFFKFPN